MPRYYDPLPRDPGFVIVAGMIWAEKHAIEIGMVRRPGS
jgi:hypothetical protein